jgi:hypothetical protein
VVQLRCSAIRRDRRWTEQADDETHSSVTSKFAEVAPFDSRLPTRSHHLPGEVDLVVVMVHSTGYDKRGAG